MNVLSCAATLGLPVVCWVIVEKWGAHIDGIYGQTLSPKRVYRRCQLQAGDSDKSAGSTPLFPAPQSNKAAVAEHRV